MPTPTRLTLSELGQMVKADREGLNETQTEYGARFGMNKQGISAIEHGRYPKHTIYRIEQLAAHLGIDPDAIRIAANRPTALIRRHIIDPKTRSPDAIRATHHALTMLGFTDEPTDSTPTKETTL